MHRPEIHRDYQRDRHADLLRLARTGELAARIGRSRDEERRSFLARLQREPSAEPSAVRPATSA
jgi:hypothetical protein